MPSLVLAGGAIDIAVHQPQCLIHGGGIRSIDVVDVGIRVREVRAGHPGQPRLTAVGEAQLLLDAMSIVLALKKLMYAVADQGIG